VPCWALRLSHPSPKLLVPVLCLCHVKFSSPTHIDGEAQGNRCRRRACTSGQGLWSSGFLLHIRQTGVQHKATVSGHGSGSRVQSGSGCTAPFSVRTRLTGRWVTVTLALPRRGGNRNSLGHLSTNYRPQMSSSTTTFSSPTISLYSDLVDRLPPQICTVTPSFTKARTACVRSPSPETILS
jgi:hypothetical protein